ncbi:MAG: SDR family NAD(P)-dependent oxidoreductase, partial [Deltaproteobacteria bacterium]|nr:SDR family NAD(P)-dependent oxidoreductase [Deltaproteobacteria bacterium]
TGFLRVARAFVPGLAARKKGHIVHLGSLAGHGVYEGGSVYCATKHAVRAVSQTLRLELSGTNVRLTEIAPGSVETEFSVVRMGDEQKAKAVYQGYEPLVADDIADCVLWACTRPAHVNIGEIVLTPVAQGGLTKFHRV